MWSQLVHARLTLDDGSVTELSEIELDLWFLILAIAGSETTRNAIAIGLKTLLEHPDEMERLRAHPEMIDTAVDEIIRWSSPVLYHRRTIAADTELRGVPLTGDLPITMFWPAANRDEQVFADPFRFDLGRTPNDHVAFGGGGPHYCLGANLAKREVKVMLAELLFAGRRPRVRHLRRRRGSALVGAGHGGARRHRTRSPAAPLLDAQLTDGARLGARSPEADPHGFRAHLPHERPRTLVLRQIDIDSVDICLSGARLPVGAERPGTPMFALRIPAASAPPGLPRRSGGIGRRASLRG